jgi:Zn finger protein HypA/HybF involved in hydrogenase expression
MERLSSKVQDSCLECRQAVWAGCFAVYRYCPSCRISREYTAYEANQAKVSRETVIENVQRRLRLNETDSACKECAQYIKCVTLETI